MSEPEEQLPTLRIVRGEPTDVEVAALVTGLSGLSGGVGPAEARPWSRWADRASRMRGPLSHGPGAWRASGR